MWKTNLISIIVVCIFAEGKLQLALRNSAFEFLLEAYNELNQEMSSKQNRFKRTLQADMNVLTGSHHRDIEKCNNIIAFPSKVAAKSDTRLPKTAASDMILNFNTQDVPKDLQLVHCVFRIYQDPSFGRFQDDDTAANITILLYKKIFNREDQMNEFKILSSMNATTKYEGWLEFNITRLMSNWLRHNSMHHHVNEILVSVILNTKPLSYNNEYNKVQIKAIDTGLIGTNLEFEDRQPFIIGYFHGPELLTRIQNLRLKREIPKRKSKTEYFPEIYQAPKTCERLNFTVDFNKELREDWIIAPSKFDAYFCSGECNFPLGSKMNATNHAIVQTLMHLKKPNLPKPCCVPTELGSISILRYLNKNKDSVNLKTYPQSVAKECGCL